MESLRLPLSQGQFAILDSADYDRAIRHCWHAFQIHRTWYAATSISRKRVYLHRFVMQPEKGMEVDHINGDGLDNRRCNLRIVSHKQNLRNQRLHVGSTSGFKGVSWDKERRRWAAHIKYDGKKRFLGRFACREDAARAYNVRAAEVFGDQAALNPI
jgi:hypothetical protein